MQSLTPEAGPDLELIRLSQLPECQHLITGMSMREDFLTKSCLYMQSTTSGEERNDP